MDYFFEGAGIAFLGGVVFVVLAAVSMGIGRKLEAKPTPIKECNAVENTISSP